MEKARRRERGKIALLSRLFDIIKNNSAMENVKINIKYIKDSAFRKKIKTETIKLTKST